MSTEQANGYIEALKDLSELEIEIGFVEATRKCKFFPNPAEVRNAADAAKERAAAPRPTTYPPHTCQQCGGSGWQVVAHPRRLEHPAWTEATMAIPCKHA